MKLLTATKHAIVVIQSRDISFAGHSLLLLPRTKKLHVHFWNFQRLILIIRSFWHWYSAQNFCQIRQVRRGARARELSTATTCEPDAGQSLFGVDNANSLSLTQTSWTGTGEPL